MAGLRAAVAPALAIALLSGGAVSFHGCASDPGPRFEQARGAGRTHVVRRGENLYRIGKRYGVPAEVLQEVNDIRDSRMLRVGQRLWIPPAGRKGSLRSLRQRARAEARGGSGVAFRWPVRGRLTSRYGSRRGSHEGVDIAAPSGTKVVAAEAGKVIFAGRMSDYGKMVVLKHAGSYRSVYAHVRRFHVRKGHFVESGQRIAEVGSTGNARGSHLHFPQHQRFLWKTNHSQPDAIRFHGLPVPPVQGDDRLTRSLRGFFSRVRAGFSRSRRPDSRWQPGSPPTLRRDS